MTFTTEIPTSPGDFRWKRYMDSPEYLVEVKTGPRGLSVILGYEEGPPSRFIGLWCRLVPAEEVTTLKVDFNDPAAKMLLIGCLKWIRRIEERAEDLPALFLDNCDPKPLRQEIEVYLGRRAKRVVEGKE